MRRHWRHVVWSLQLGDSGATRNSTSVAYAAAYTPQSFQFVCCVLVTIDIGSFPCASRRVANNCNSCFMMLPSWYSSPILRTESSVLTCFLSEQDYTSVFHAHTSTLSCSSVWFAGAAYFAIAISVWVCFAVDRAYDNWHCHCSIDNALVQFSSSSHTALMSSPQLIVCNLLLCRELWQKPRCSITFSFS